MENDAFNTVYPTAAAANLAVVKQYLNELFAGQDLLNSKIQAATDAAELFEIFKEQQYDRDRQLIGKLEQLESEIKRIREWYRYNKDN